MLHSLDFKPKMSPNTNPSRKPLKTLDSYMALCIIVPTPFVRRVYFEISKNVTLIEKFSHENFSLNNVQVRHTFI